VQIATPVEPFSGLEGMTLKVRGMYYGIRKEKRMPKQNETISFLFGYPVVVPTEREDPDTCDELPSFGMSFLEKMKNK
tara:strand:+ start:198 stop:431 length:234 start_codon:yes stop_codon:yes gene_type:complete